MSTIQSQFSMFHIDSGLNVSASAQRTTVESSFSSDAITVTTTPEAVSLGDITVPRQIALKLVSGDDLLVSLDGGSTYPLSLHGTGDAFVVNLESREVSAITCVADVADSLDGLYFDLADLAGPVRVWMNTSGGAAVAPATPTGGRLIEVAITTGAANTAVGAAILAALNTDAAFIATLATATLTITDVAPGARTNIAAGTSTFTSASSAGSVAAASVYLKSLGTSQVVVAVAPN